MFHCHTVQPTAHSICAKPKGSLRPLAANKKMRLDPESRCLHS